MYVLIRQTWAGAFMQTARLLELRGIQKRFGGVHAEGRGF